MINFTLEPIVVVYKTSQFLSLSYGFPDDRGKGKVKYWTIFGRSI